MKQPRHEARDVQFEAFPTLRVRGSVSKSDQKCLRRGRKSCRSRGGIQPIADEFEFGADAPCAETHGRLRTVGHRARNDARPEIVSELAYPKPRRYELRCESPRRLLQSGHP